MSDLADRYFDKALLAVRNHDYPRARSLLVEAIKLRPDFIEAWVVRGNICHAMEEPFEALLHYDRALNIREDLHDAWNNRGIAFGDLGLFLSAEESFRKSAELMPAVEPHMGLASMYCTLDRLEDAVAEYRKVIKIEPGFLDARFNLGVTLLGLGQWEEGFREYEYRWKNTLYPPRAYRHYPKWQGEDLNGKRILLYPEQGYGDEIMAQRFILALQRQYDCAIVLQARGPTMRLAKASWPDVIVTAMHEEPPCTVDYSCPLLDVPMAMGMSWHDVPRPERYLSGLAHPGFDERLAALPDGLNVGLCWISGSHHATARGGQRSKSIALPWLLPLAIPGVNLISLQKDAHDPHGARMPPEMNLIDWTGELHDFADTAALIEALDLVVTVDTSVAHLAGALGKRTLNLVRLSGYWPWVAADVVGDPEHSIWYPSMTLLRQPSLGNWVEPIERASKYIDAQLQQRATAREAA